MSTPSRQYINDAVESASAVGRRMRSKSFKKQRFDYKWWFGISCNFGNAAFSHLLISTAAVNRFEDDWYTDAQTLILKDRP